MPAFVLPVPKESSGLTGTSAIATEAVLRLYCSHTKQTQMTNALTGSALLEMIRKMEDADRSTQCLTCGYVRENGKPAFTAFFEAILEARGVITNAQELKAECVDYQEQIDELLEDYDALAIKAFIDLYGEEELENFEDAYQGEMTGAEFAEQLVTDCYCLDIPSFVCVDWSATWDQLSYDYDEQDGYIFCRHW